MQSQKVLSWSLVAVVGSAITSTTVTSGQRTDGQELERPTIDVISDEALADVPESLRPFCKWDVRQTDDVRLTNAQDLEQARKSSRSWIHAVLNDDFVPDDVADRIVGVTEDIHGYDATRVAFESNSFRFLVTQTTDRIVAVVRPVVEEDRVTRPTRKGLERFVAERASALFKHPEVILYLCDEVRGTPFGLEITVGGRPAGEAEIRAQEAELRRLDPSLPGPFVGGAWNYWWGQVYMASDGHVLILSAGKAYGGSARAVIIKDWLRKDKLPGTKYSSFRSPLPPEAASTEKGD